MDKIHMKNMERLNISLLEEEYIYNRRTKKEESTGELTLAGDLETQAKNIIGILELHKNGNTYTFDTDTGRQTITKNFIELSNVLMKYFNKYKLSGKGLEYSRSKWKEIAQNVEPEVEVYKENEKYISFMNSTIDVDKSMEEKKLVMHKDVMRVDTTFRYDYISKSSDLNPKAKELYKRVMNNYTKGLSAPKKKEWIKHLEMITGYLLMPINVDHIFLFKSAPGTGKSSWKDIMEKLYNMFSGEYDPSSSDIFAEESIYKKRFGFNSDITGGKWSRDKQLQKISSSESLSVRLHGTPTTTWYKPKVNLLFMTNDFMEAAHNSGLWRRMHIFYFNKPLGKDSVINNVKSRMLKKEFIEVVIHQAMKALNSYFEDPSQMDNDKELIKIEMAGENVVSKFLNEWYKSSDYQALIHQDELFDYFKLWLFNRDTVNKYKVVLHFRKAVEKLIDADAWVKQRNIPGEGKSKRMFNFDERNKGAKENSEWSNWNEKRTNNNEWGVEL